MSGKFFFRILPFLAMMSFKRQATDPPSPKSIAAQYARADSLFNLLHNTAVTDSAALLGFRQIVAQAATVQRFGLTDSIFFQSYYKEGVLLEVNGRYSEATSAYLHALDYAPDETQKLKMYVFAGAGYYNLNNFDSSNYFLLKAEENPGGLLAKEDLVRLFNTLGVLYYDNGNYLQSKNYFNQALNNLQPKNPADQVNAVSIRLNMGTCFFRLGLFEQSLAIYREALSYRLFLNEIYLNMGRAYAGLHRYSEALHAFRRVEVQKLPRVLNEMASVALESGHADSAEVWLNRFRNEKQVWKMSAPDAGINALYFGELDLHRSDPESALSHLQEAIIRFSGNFRNTDIRTNPSGFTGTFAYYKLFDALYKKAGAWRLLYKKSGSPSDLRLSFDTYQSTLKLLTYIERSYEMDDAKILLKEKSAQVYQEAMQVCLELSSLFPKDHYLEDAFLISERNKASVMASHLREQHFHFLSEKEDALIHQERNLKFNLARLSIMADQKSGAELPNRMSAEKSDYETQLAAVQKKMEQNSRYYQLKYQEDYPSVGSLQKTLGKDQAMISLTNTPDAIHVFVITSSAFRYVKLDSGETIRTAIRSWIQILQSSDNGKHPDSKKLSSILYQRLIRPLEELAGDREEWILVPDGIFFMLPLESLPSDTSGGLVLEKHALSYQFSSRFIQEKRSAGMSSDFRQAVLSFAPFAAKGADLQNEGMGFLQRLPGSKAEIASLPGRQYADSAATKDKFLQLLNQFPIIHLATHATADMNDPDASYIAFYPAWGMRSEDCLFLGELYGLRMDSCQLIIISACETGKGQLVRNEGVMSFARAFLYAGCPSTVNSLWKADDRSTSSILQQFHIYLREGYSKSKALQQAKLDFIRDNPLYRNPAYWSHLILTGNAGALYKKKWPYGWAVFGICCCSLIMFVIRKRKKVDAFHRS
jgi:CHAT domain-containing protein